MEAAIVSVFLRTFIPKLWDVIKESHELRDAIEEDIKYIQDEIRMVAATIEDHQLSEKRISNVQRESIKQARDLARDIEDCVDRFLHRAARHPLTPKQFANKIKHFREKAEKACEGLSTSAPPSSDEPEDRYVPSWDLVGMDEPIKEILWEAGSQFGGKLKVISIVGSGGLGKTLLARQVYENDEVGRKFSTRAWVSAADKDAEEFLKEILKQVDNGASTSTDVERRVRSCLDGQRYFIVIDDVRTKEQCTMIESAFPDDVDSRIIVTTTIQSVADRCSSDDGHVYNMSALNDKDSKQLFFNVYSKGKYSDTDSEEFDSSGLLKKCDGLPLALVSTAKFLKGGKLNEYRCEEACRKLCAPEDGERLERMQWVLVNKYSSLSGHGLKASLLYFYMFPRDRPTRKNSLIRRWLAEGFAEARHRCSPQDVAVGNLNTLIDRNIIQSMEVSNNRNVKRCRPPGMMLEYISLKSMSEDFAVFVSDEAPAAKRIRRLSLHHQRSSTDGAWSDIDLSLVRTLAISGEACKDILDFSKYELLRVLDLKECANLNGEHVDKICDLLLLKYLSLGESIGKVPSKISKMKLLETLDMRTTETVMVYAEVLLLPSLTHLLGKFKLAKRAYERNPEKLENFLKEDSKLERLSGFVTGKDEGFPQLMLHMRRLRKVKIWFDPAHGTNLTHLEEAVKQFIGEGYHMPRGNRSLSIDFAGRSVPFNGSNQYPGYLTSLKLKGKLDHFPGFVAKVDSIQKLCLSSTSLSRKLIIEGLNQLCTLKYLKLLEDDLSDLDPKDMQFPWLRGICLSVKSDGLPHPQIMENFANLEEVYLYSSVGEGTRRRWKEASHRHPKRPIVWFGASAHLAAKGYVGGAGPSAARFQ